jgi:hypothetical protein
MIELHTVDGRVFLLMIKKIAWVREPGEDDDCGAVVVVDTSMGDGTFRVRETYTQVYGMLLARERML